MSDWLLYLTITGVLAFAASSWWWVRRLRARHIRSAVWEETHSPALGRQKVAVVLNPTKAKSAETRTLIRKACLEAGWEVPRFFETTAEDPGFAQTRAAMAYGADVILACGGDGTVRVAAEILAGTATPMGLVPLGTGNLLARNIDLDVADLPGNVQTALFGQQRFIDTARMRLENSETGASADHTFLVIAGIGMDAEVVSDTNDGLKKAVGWLAYTEAGVRHLPGRRKRVSLALDGQPPQARKIRSVLFANCGLVPGGIDFIPQAMIDDGMLDVVVMSPRSAVGWLAMYWKILLKHTRDLPVMSYYRCGRITIRCAEPMPTQVDGDPSGEATQVTVQVAPRSLLVRVKNGTVTG